MPIADRSKVLTDQKTPSEKFDAKAMIARHRHRRDGPEPWPCRAETDRAARARVPADVAVNSMS